MKRYLLLPLLLLSGCATWSKHQVVPQADGRYRIAVLPIQSEVKIKSLKSIQTLPKGYVHPKNEEALARSRLQEVQTRMISSLTDKLSATGKFDVVPDTEVREAMTRLNISTDSPKHSPDELARLGRQLNVPSILDITLGGYGRVKKKWLFLMFLDGTAETATQGAATAALTSNPWIIAGVMAEEALQEIAVWCGSIYFFDRIFTPVILDARLISAFDRKAVWKDTSVATTHFKAVRKLPKEERGKKEVRLALVSEKALQKLADGLNAAAGRNMKRARP